MSASRTKTTSNVPAGSGRRALTASMIAIATVTMMFLGSGPARAGHHPNPVGNLVKTVHKTLNGGLKHQANASVPSRDAPNPPTSDSDSPGHETPNPQAPDHGSSYVGQITLGGNNLLDLANGKSRANDNNSTSADSTLLAVGGTEIIGSHATSGGTQQSHGGVPTTPLCTASNGALCADLLWSDSYATDNGTSSRASTDSGFLGLCLGGSTAPASGTPCNAPVQASLLGNTSSVDRNQNSGRTKADSTSGVLGLCLLPGQIVASCAAGAGLLYSEGHADSNGSASRKSYVAALSIAGHDLGLPADPSAPFGYSIPVNCPATGSVLCVFGNQGETYLAPGLAGTSQTALDIFALIPAQLPSQVPSTLHVQLAQSETLVHNNGGRAVVSPPESPEPPHAPAHARPAAAVDEGILPNTGGVWSGLLSLGLLLLGVGALSTAWNRRGVTMA